MKYICHYKKNLTWKSFYIQTFLLIFVLIGTVNSIAQEEPLSFVEKCETLESVDVKIIKDIDAEKLLDDELKREKKADDLELLVFAKEFDVKERFEILFSPENSGTWETLPNNFCIWRLRIHAYGAKNINLGITRLEIPEGAQLWIYDESCRQVYGPYQSSIADQLGQLWTPAIIGDMIVVELNLPPGLANSAKVEVGKVNVGFREFSLPDQFGKYKKRISKKHVDVECMKGNDWKNQKNSVAFFTIKGKYLARSGVLLNSLSGGEELRPFFITAYHGLKHFLDESETMVFYWNVETKTCSDLELKKVYAQTGATFVAKLNYEDSTDLLLLELKERPRDEWNVYYSGWSAINSSLKKGVGIHHPWLDVKKISITNDGIDTAPRPGGNYPFYWKVSWEKGTVQAGCSGSPLWDNDNKEYCVGILSGRKYDIVDGKKVFFAYYGKFSNSWEFLKKYLDPHEKSNKKLDGSYRFED